MYKETNSTSEANIQPYKINYFLYGRYLSSDKIFIFDNEQLGYPLLNLYSQ